MKNCVEYIFTAEHFDSGNKWCVALALKHNEDVIRRNAIRVLDGKLTEQQAIERAMPILLGWAVEYVEKVSMSQ